MISPRPRLHGGGRRSVREQGRGEDEFRPASSRGGAGALWEQRVRGRSLGTCPPAARRISGRKERSPPPRFFTPLRCVQNDMKGFLCCVQSYGVRVGMNDESPPASSQGGRRFVRGQGRGRRWVPAYARTREGVVEMWQGRPRGAPLRWS